RAARWGALGSLLSGLLRGRARTVPGRAPSFRRSSRTRHRPDHDGGGAGLDVGGAAARAAPAASHAYRPPAASGQGIRAHVRVELEGELARRPDAVGRGSAGLESL